MIPGAGKRRANRPLGEKTSAAGRDRFSRTSFFSKVQRSSGSGLHLAPGVMSLFPTAAAVDAASTGRPNLSQGGLAFLGAGPRSGDT